MAASGNYFNTYKQLTTFAKQRRDQSVLVLWVLGIIFVAMILLIPVISQFSTRFLLGHINLPHHDSKPAMYYFVASYYLVHGLLILVITPFYMAFVMTAIQYLRGKSINFSSAMSYHKKYVTVALTLLLVWLIASTPYVLLCFICMLFRNSYFNLSLHLLLNIYYYLSMFFYLSSIFMVALIIDQNCPITKVFYRSMKYGMLTLIVTTRGLLKPIVFILIAIGSVLAIYLVVFIVAAIIGAVTAIGAIIGLLAGEGINNPGYSSHSSGIFDFLANYPSFLQLFNFLFFVGEIVLALIIVLSLVKISLYLASCYLRFADPRKDQVKSLSD